MLKKKHKYTSGFPNLGIKSKTWGFTPQTGGVRAVEEPPARPLARFSSENTSETENKCKEPRGRDAFRGWDVIWGRQHKHKGWF